jgi:hypothetical protein
VFASLWVANPRKGRLWLKTAYCLSAKGVATAKQRFDRAVGTAGAPFGKYKKSIFFQRNKIAPISQWKYESFSIRRTPLAFFGVELHEFLLANQSNPFVP